MWSRVFQRSSLFQQKYSCIKICPKCFRTLTTMRNLHLKPSVSIINKRLPAVTLSRLYSDSTKNENEAESSKEKKDEKKSEKPELKFTKKEKFQGGMTWRSVTFSAVVGSLILGMLWNEKRKKDEKIERQRKRSIGKSKIGGPWELVRTDGKVCTQEDYKGSWLLIYFGFTNCPDICPDELEKMVQTAKLLEEAGVKIVPVFFTVDPERDTRERVKKYCADFSPDLVGFTGSKDQVHKVTRTFRVYYSQGPRDDWNDYIVDHTVIMYLIDPEGNFVDYYGQNRKAQEISNAIRLQTLKFNKGKEKGWW